MHLKYAIRTTQYAIRILIASIFMLNNIAYAIDLSAKAHLRAPLKTATYKRIEQVMSKPVAINTVDTEPKESTFLSRFKQGAIIEIKDYNEYSEREEKKAAELKDFIVSRGINIIKDEKEIKHIYSRVDVDVDNCEKGSDRWGDARGGGGRRRPGGGRGGRAGEPRRVVGKFPGMRPCPRFSSLVRGRPDTPEPLS